MKRENDEQINKFNWIFQSFYISIPIEIRPSEKIAMVYYVMVEHSDLIFFLLERKSSSLIQLFEDAKGVEEKIWACKMLRDQAHVEDIQAYEQKKNVGIIQI